MDGASYIGLSREVPADARSRLMARVQRELAAPVLDEAHDVARYAVARHGDAIGPVLFYGSCLRASSPEGVMDVYLLSRSHTAFHGEDARGRTLAALNWLVPPNIYFWSIPHPEHGALRVKVAVVSLAQFREACAVPAVSPSIWARFCQPSVLLEGGDASTRDEVAGAIVEAILTAAHWAAHLGPAQGTPRDYWTALFAATYGAELRPERDNRPSIIYDANPERYDAILKDAWTALGIPFRETAGVLHPEVSGSARATATRAFEARQRGGKLISIARLVKGTLTFTGGVDYLAWKIERHSGVSLDLRDWERRHPVLGAPAVLLRLLRAGAVR